MMGLPREFAVSGRTAGQRAMVQVRGELDMYTAPRLRERLPEVFDEGARTVTVDLSEVDFLDSTALSVLIGALRRFREADGDLILSGPTPSTYRVLEICRLTRVFTILAAEEREGAAEG